MTIKPRRITKRSPSLLALIGVVLLAAGAATWFLMPSPKFTARAKLYVSAIPPHILFPDASHENHEDFVRRQVELIRDRFVLTAALRLPEVAGLSIIQEQADAVQWLESELKVETPSSEFIHISLSGDRPLELQKLVSAVTHSYLDNVVDNESTLRKKKLDDLRKIHQRFNDRWKEKRDTVRRLQKENGALTTQSMALLQQIDSENLQRAKQELSQVHSDLRQLRVELTLQPEWSEQVWPSYVAVLNCQPGPGLPINHAIVSLLHDDAHLFPQAAKGNRRQEREKLRFLEAMEKALLSDAKRLEQSTKQIRKDAVDLGELKEQLEKVEKVMQKAAEKIESMEVEQNAPSRITLLSKDEKGNPQAMLYKPKETNRKWMTRGAAALAGPGSLLLVLALLWFAGRSLVLDRWTT